MGSLKLSARRRSWMGLPLFLSFFLALMLVASSLQGTWDVAYASHCGVGTGIGTGTGTIPSGSAVGTATGSATATFKVVVSASPTSLTADGSTISTVTAVVTSGSSGIASATVNFTSDLGTVTVGSTSSTASYPPTRAQVSTTTNSSGVATATLKSSTAGSATVDAVVQDTGGTARACPQTTVTFTTAASEPSEPSAPSAAPAPTAEPTVAPTVGPTVEPTVAPTVEPTVGPTVGPTVEPTAAPAPSPTIVEAPTTTQPLAPGSSGEMGVKGGATVDGGTSLNIPTGTMSTTASVSLTVSDIAPAGATTSGGEILNKTVEVTIPDAREIASIRINLTTADLGGRKIDDIRGGYVGPSGVVVPVPLRVIDVALAIVELDVIHTSKFTLFAVTVPGPSLTAPDDRATLTTLGATLTWTNPAGTTQYQIQVSPFNDDGPGINLIRNVETSYTVMAPSFGGTDANYVMLPDMTYVWRVRSTTVTTAPKEADWTAWSNPRTFTTAKASSATISRVSPEMRGDVTSLTPTLTWANSDKAVFYYEVQVSKDPNFGAGPGSPMLYWELVHGGASTPANSYVIPSKFPLEAGTSYYWRVRPRIQGNGTPLGWSFGYSFTTP